jgi:iron complex transport system substrate-binding protein
MCFSFTYIREESMRRLFFLLPLMLTAVLGVPQTGHARSAVGSAPFPVTITDDHGNKVQITHAPKRIVTLFAAYTEDIFALGLEKRLVGDASQYADYASDDQGKPLGRKFKYPQEWPTKLGRDYPMVAPKLTHVEGGVSLQSQFNLETIESLQPDLIIAPYYPSQQQTYQKLHDLGFTVIFLDPSSVNGVFHDVEVLGKATGATTQAAALVGTMKKDLQTLKSKVGHVKSRPRVFYEVYASSDTPSPFTAGPGTLPDQAIKLAGGKNIADSVTSCSGQLCYPQLDPEEIVRQNPQVIVLADYPDITPGAVRGRQGWNSISAVQTGKIFPINTDVLSKFGPRVVIGVADMARLIHPEVFKKKN